MQKKKTQTTTASSCFSKLPFSVVKIYIFGFCLFMGNVQNNSSLVLHLVICKATTSHLRHPQCHHRQPHQELNRWINLGERLCVSLCVYL